MASYRLLIKKSAAKELEAIPGKKDVYEIQDDILVVYVVRIADRKDVYRKG